MTVSRTEALASIERATPGLCKNIPTENCGWFVTQIRHAVEDYFAHPRARELAEEIMVFERALRGPPANVLATFDSLSPVNLEMISLLGDLPDRNQLANPRTRAEAIKKLRSLIVTGAYVARAEDNKTKNPRKRILKGTEPPSQNRKKEKLVGQNQLKHALKHELTHFPEHWLITRLAAAYAGATGNHVTRGSEGYGPSPFEEMVQIIWKALDIERPKSVEHLVRKHTERRRPGFGEPERRHGA